MSVSVNNLRRIIKEALDAAYSIIGVPKNSSAEDLKKAYRAKVVQLHPDRNKDKDTTKDMVQLNAAWSVLSDPDKRKRYDMYGDKTVDGFGSSAQTPKSSSAPKSSYNSNSYGSESGGAPHRNHSEPEVGYSNFYVNNKDNTYVVVSYLRFAKSVIEKGTYGSPPEKSKTTNWIDFSGGDYETASAARTNWFLNFHEKLKSSGYVRSFLDPRKTEDDPSNSRSKVGNDPRKKPRAKNNRSVDFHAKLYFERAASNSFYVMKTVGLVGIDFVRGKIGRAGIPNRRLFLTNQQVEHFIKTETENLIRSGFVEKPFSVWENRQSSTTPNSEEPRPEPPKQNTQSSSSKSKETYKVYGKRNGAAASTRVKSKVYVSDVKSKFKAGDKVSVNVGPDGKLNVKDPQTGHSQVWTAESFDKYVGKVLNEVIEAKTLQTLIKEVLLTKNLV